MTQYVKYISETQIEYPPKNKGDILNYNLDIEQLIIDGYKELIPTEIPENINRLFHIGYQENSDNIQEIIVYEETQQEADTRELNDKKRAKIIENDTARDTALNQGVTYKDVLFDSDTDQKVNLLAMVSALTGEETLYWYGKDNQPLLCTKEDLINIGGLITQLHTFCWTENAQIKGEINEAETAEEVEAITIDYNAVRSN